MNRNSIVYLGLSIILAGCGGSLGQAALNGLEQGGIPARSIVAAVGGGGATGGVRPAAQAGQSPGMSLDIPTASDADPYWRQMDALFQQQCIDRIRAIPVTEDNLAAYSDLHSRCFAEKTLRSNAVSSQLFFEVVDSPTWPRPKADLIAAGKCYETLVNRGDFTFDLQRVAGLPEQLKVLEQQRRFGALPTSLQASFEAWPAKLKAMEHCGDQHWPYWKAAIRFQVMLRSAKHGMEYQWQALSSAVNERQEKERQARLEAERRRQAMLCQQRLDDFRKNLAVGALTNMGKVVKKEGNTFFFEENQCAREEVHQSRERVATIMNTGCPNCLPQSVYDLVQTRQCVEWKTVLIGRNRSQLKPARASEDCP